MKRSKTGYFSFSVFLPTFLVIAMIGIFNIHVFSSFIEFETIPFKQAVAIVLLWLVLSLLITFLIRYNTIRLYEMPMKRLAKATHEVAHGDFSVYVEPIHTSEKYDYLDYMILDFNKMVEELGSVETLKTDFFSHVSHEIKTPLAVIQNYAQLLESDELSEQSRKEYAQIINDSTKKLSHLITNILKINKLEKQNIDCHYENYDICYQICDCLLSFEKLWDQKNMDIEVNIEEKRVVFSDRELMMLVWNNLISNAIKFTDVKGKITVKEWVEKQRCIVEISDNGCGIDDKTMEHIFDKFYQGDTSHAMQGNGLGLALVAQIMPLLNGEITVTSQVGEGSTFRVGIPLYAQETEDIGHD